MSAVTAPIVPSLIGRYRCTFPVGADRVAQPCDRDRGHGDPAHDQPDTSELGGRWPLTQQHHAQPDRHDRLDEQDQRGHDGGQTRQRDRDEEIPE